MPTVKSSIPNVVLRVRTEWESNKRLQIIAGLAFVLLVLLMHGQVNELRLSKLKEYDQQLVKLEDLNRLAKQKVWFQRAEVSTQLLLTQKKRIWMASSEGEIQARLRDWLQRQAQEVGLNVGRLQLEMGVPPRGGDYRPLRVGIQGDYTPGILQQFIQRLNTAPSSILVDLDQIHMGTSPFYRLDLTVWVDVTGSKKDEVPK